MASGHRVPHQQAAHMAAPTEGQSINKTLANGEPSTHGPKQMGWMAPAHGIEVPSVEAIRQPRAKGAIRYPCIPSGPAVMCAPFNQLTLAMCCKFTAMASWAEVVTFRNH
jgi:hypothetical protein